MSDKPGQTAEGASESFEDVLLRLDHLVAMRTWEAGHKDGRRGKEPFSFTFPDQQTVYDDGYATGVQERRPS